MPSLAVSTLPADSLEVDAAAGIEDLEIVQRCPGVLQARIDQADVGREMLIDRVPVHIGRIDRLIQAEEPSVDIGASDLPTLAGL